MALEPAMTEPVQPRLDQPEPDYTDLRRGPAETYDAYVCRMLQQARRHLGQSDDRKDRR
jgi:hypothetical protein